MKKTKNLLLIVLMVLFFPVKSWMGLSQLLALQASKRATAQPSKSSSQGKYQRLFDQVGTRCYPGLVSLDAVASSDLQSGPGAGKPGQGIHAPALFPVAAPAARRARNRAVSAVEDLALVSDIEMATFKDGELIVIGPPASAGNRFRPDDWYVVFKAIASTEAPGVSIDPGPNPSIMQVRYFGGIQTSALGQTFFEADRTLKLMSTGFDNYTCALWPARPRIVPTELDLAFREETSGADSRNRPEGWHRFWFEPSDNPVETEGLAMRIPKDRLMVKEEPVPPGSPSAKSAREFAAAITTNFQALAGKIPVFAELQREAALVALAKWIRDKRVLVDEDWTKPAPGSPSAPVNTPSITVVRATISDRAYLSLGIHGGVDFQRDNHYTGQSPEMRRLGSAADTSRPKSRSSWSFLFEGRKYFAFGLPVRQALPVVPQWVAWKGDSSYNLVQPKTYSEFVPDSNFAVNNQGPEELTVQITGSINKTERVPPNSIAMVRVVPGAYKLRLASKCGTKDYALQIAENERHELQYFCGPAPNDAHVPPVGTFEVNNKMGSAITVNVAGVSRNVPEGKCTIRLSPGYYEATISSRCGTAKEHLNVTRGSTYTGEYSCESR